MSLACDYGVQACIDEAKRLFAQWMANEENNPYVKVLNFCSNFFNFFCNVVYFYALTSADFFENNFFKTVVQEHFRASNGLDPD